MDLADWQNLHDRLNQAHRHYLSCGFGTRDLWIMHRAVYEKLQAADREWVNCRRRGFSTPKFDQLLIEAEQALKNFEGYIIIAKLSDKGPK